MREKFNVLNTVFTCTRFCPEDLMCFFGATHYKITRFYPILYPEEYFMIRALHSEGFGILKDYMPNEKRYEKIKYVLSNFGFKYPFSVALEYFREFCLRSTMRK